MSPDNPSTLEARKSSEGGTDTSEESWDYEDEDDFQSSSFDDRLQLVDDGLFIGSLAAEHNLKGLRDAGITHVIQVADGLAPSHPDSGLTYLTLPLQDRPSEDLGAHLGTCIDFIGEAHKQGGSALVHCIAGVSRSAAVCMGWLMWRHALSADQAFARLHSVRPSVRPNAGFRRQLERFGQLGCDVARWTPWSGGAECCEDPLTLVLKTVQQMTLSVDSLESL